MLPESLSRRCTALAAVAMLSCAVPALADEAGEVNRLLREGQQTEALNRANAWLADHADDPRMRFLKGLVLSEMRRTDDAIAVFARLAAEYPKRAELQNNLAVLYGAGGQYAKARTALESAIAMKPDYAAAHENLGDIYARLAIQSYEQAQQSDPAGGALAKRKAIEQALGATGEPAPAVGSAASEPVREQVMIEPPPRKAAPEPDASIVSDREAVLKTVGDWAAAWSRRDVNAYLGYYASDFQTPAHVSRRKWERSRRARIAGRNSIEVRIESPQVTFVDDKATVRFRQVYSANAYQDETNKSLALAKQKSGAWKIVQERAE